MFGSHERSLKALSRFYNSVAWQPQVQKSQKSRNYYFEPVTQVKQWFSEFEYHTDAKQSQNYIQNFKLVSVAIT